MQSYPIKLLQDEDKVAFIPFTNSNAILVEGGKTLQDTLDVKLDPADVKAGADIKVTPGIDNTTVAWVRPTNLNVKNDLTTASSGQGVLDAHQGKILLDNINTRILASEKGKPNGVATLDGEGHVPSAQLPSYVDDIIEAYIRNGATGLSKEWLSLTEGGAALEPEKGKIYVIMSAGDWQNKQYRWGGSTYALCNPSDVNSVNGMTGVITLKTLTLKTAAGAANTINETYNAGTDKTVTINVPSKTSHITNDSGFITASASITGNAATATTADKTKGTLTIKMKNYDTNTETTDTFNGNTDKTITIGVPTKVSQLTNDSQYITASASITGNAATATTASKTTGTLTIQRNSTNVGTFNGSSNQTVNISVPTKVSQLDNDSKFLTSVPIASSTTSGTVKVGTGLAINTNGVLYVTGEGVTADEVEWDNINGKPTDVSYFNNDAGYITANDFITGNAATATKLATARNINGVAFDGTKDITVTANPTSNSLTNQDLNIITTPGFYYAGGGNTTTNKPSGVDAFGLIVYKTATGYTTQDLIEGNSTAGKRWTRQYTGSAWSAWGNIYTSFAPQTSITGNAATATTASKTTGTLTIQKNGTNVDTFNGSTSKTVNITVPTNNNQLTNGAGYITASGSITGNAGTATKLATKRTISLTGSVTGSGEFDGSGNLSIDTTTNHTHNYAGSASAGGAANSVKTNLTIKLNGGSTEGTNLFTFNGSAAKTVNITASGIGAAASSHTHSYLPLSGGDLTGKVNSSFTSSTWLNSVNGGSAFNITGTSFTGWISGKTKNGAMAIATYPNNSDLWYLGYKSNTTIADGSNNYDKQLTWNGATGELTSTSFNGSLTGNASSATKVNTNLIIKLNGGSTEGTNLFTFNGSTAKTVNITASGIGAAASSHTHNYAGSSSAGGAANSTKASLTLTKNGSNTVFNGGTAYTVTVPTVHTGTGAPAASLGQNGDIYIVTG